MKLAQKYFDVEMDIFNVTRSVKTYSALMTAYEKAGLFEEALLLLHRMKNDGVVEPNVVTYSAAILACGNAGRWVEFINLLYMVSRTKPTIYVTGL